MKSRRLAPEPSWLRKHTQPTYGSVDGNCIGWRVRVRFTLLIHQITPKGEAFQNGGKSQGVRVCVYGLYNQ
jgi:hypothetical protein